VAREDEVEGEGRERRERRRWKRATSCEFVPLWRPESS